MAFLRNHQMFLQVFSKKVCFCCILGCFAEKKLPQMSQILTDGACLEFCEFCVLWEYSSPTDCTDQHRWLVALVVAWVRHGCHTLLHLCKSVKSVGTPSLQEGSVQICEICGRISQQEGWLRGYGKDAIPSYICVNPCYLWEEITARRFCEFCEFLWEEITARRFCEFCEICGRISQREGSVNSVNSVGEYHSEKVL